MRWWTESRFIWTLKSVACLLGDLVQEITDDKTKFVKFTEQINAFEWSINWSFLMVTDEDSKMHFHIQLQNNFFTGIWMYVFYRSS